MAILMENHLKVAAGHESPNVHPKVRAPFTRIRQVHLGGPLFFHGTLAGTPDRALLGAAGASEG